MAVIHVYNVKWNKMDVDYREDMPTELQLEMTDESLDSEDFEAQLSDELAWNSGVLHNGFDYEIVG